MNMGRSSYLTALYLELIVDRERVTFQSILKRQRKGDEEIKIERMRVCVCARERGRESACGEINGETEEI